MNTNELKIKKMKEIIAKYAYVSAKNHQLCVRISETKLDSNMPVYENVKITYDDKLIKISGNKINYVFVYSFGDNYTYDWFVDNYGEAANLEECTFYKRKHFFSKKKELCVYNGHHELKKRKYEEIVSNNYTLKSEDYNIYEAD